MFRKKKESEFLKMFVEVQESSNETETDETKEMTIKEFVTAFILGFKDQSARYKIVWSVRILCWVLILGVAVFGLISEGKKIFWLKQPTHRSVAARRLAQNLSHRFCPFGSLPMCRSKGVFLCQT